MGQTALPPDPLERPHLHPAPIRRPADVYERLTPAGKRPTFATLAITQLVSGIWHGLFPGYWWGPGVKAGVGRA